VGTPARFIPRNHIVAVAGILPGRRGALHNFGPGCSLMRSFAMKVFIVEDSPPMQSLLADLLQSIGGFEVVDVADSESAATEWLKRHRGDWQLVTLDLVLRDGSGFNLIQRFRKHSRGGKIVVFSEFVAPDIEGRCLEMGADAVIRKSEYLAFTDYVHQLKAGGGSHPPAVGR
jgi:DNA-binding NarL/FixJ family response regulator